MKIILNEDTNHVDTVRVALEKNHGYCPCSVEWSEDTKCMCKDFREKTDEGLCHCGLYKKVND